MLHFVCFDCRKSFKQAAYLNWSPNTRPQASDMRVVPCPQCGNEAHCLGKYFKAPPRNNIKQWQKLRLLHQHGWRGWGWDVSPRMSLRATKKYLVEKPQKERAAKTEAKQQAQNEKWRKMRKWPRIHLEQKTKPKSRP